MQFKVLAYKKALAFLKKHPFYVSPGSLKSDTYEIDLSGEVFWPGNVFSCKPPSSGEEKQQIQVVKNECKTWVTKFNLYQETFLKEVIEKTLPSSEIRDTRLVGIKEDVISRLLDEIKKHIQSNEEETTSSLEYFFPFSFKYLCCNEQETTSYIKRVVDFFTSFSEYNPQSAEMESFSEAFKNFYKILLVELEKVSMTNYKEVDASLNPDELDLDYRLKKALNKENPYTINNAFSDKVTALFDLFVLEKEDLVSKDDFEIIEYIKGLYYLEDIKSEIIVEEQKKLESLKHKTKQKVFIKSKKEILKDNNCPNNLINLLLKEDLKNVNSVAVAIKKELEKVFLQETDMLTKLSEFEMKACNYPESAKQHVRRINRVYLQLKSKINETYTKETILIKIKNEFTIGLFNQLVENFKNLLDAEDVDVSVPKKIDTALKFSYITTFSLDKKNVTSFESAPHSEIWLDNLEIFMKDCTKFVNKDIMELNAKAMLWIFAVDDWVEEQTELKMVKSAVTQLFNIMHGYLFEEDKEVFSTLLNDYTIKPEVQARFPDRSPAEELPEEFSAFKKSLDDICKQVAKEFKTLNGNASADHATKVRYSDFMKEMHGYLKAVLHECSYNLAGITLSKEEFYAQRMDTSGCKVFSIMSILASGSSVKRSALAFWKENKIEYHMNLLTSLTNGVIFSSVKEHSSYNWKHNDIYVVLVNNLRAKLTDAIEKVKKDFPDARGMPENIIEQVVTNLDNKLSEIKYTFSEIYKESSEEDLLIRLLSNQDILQSEYEKAKNQLYKDINKCSKELFEKLPDEYEYDKDKMVCLAAIWQWVDGGWIAQALTPRYKNSNQQFMLKDDFKSLLQNHNLFDFLTTENDYKKEIYSDSLTYNAQLSHARNTVYKMIKNPTLAYDKQTIGTLANCITMQYSEVFQAHYDVFEHAHYHDEIVAFDVDPYAIKLAQSLGMLEELEAFKEKYTSFCNPNKSRVEDVTEITKMLSQEFAIDSLLCSDIDFFIKYTDTASVSVSGIFKDGKLQRGKYEYNDEDEFKVYEGEFSSGIYNGHGVLKSGDSYQSTKQEGEFKQGKFMSGCVETHYEDYSFSVTKTAEASRDGGFKGPGSINIQLNGEWTNGNFNSEPYTEDINNFIEKLMKRPSFDDCFFVDSDSEENAIESEAAS